MTALDDLEAKARAATAGPWHATMDNPGREPRFIDASETVRIAQAARTRDAAYIAAASPSVVLALVSVARAAKANQSPVPDGTMQEMGTVILSRFRALDAALAALEAL